MTSGLGWHVEHILSPLSDRGHQGAMQGSELILDTGRQDTAVPVTG